MTNEVPSLAEASKIITAAFDGAEKCILALTKENRELTLKVKTWRETITDLSAENAMIRQEADDAKCMLRYVIRENGQARSLLRAITGQPVSDFGIIPVLSAESRVRLWAQVR